MEATMSSGIGARALSPMTGFEVTGVDVSRSFDAAMVAALEEIWFRTGVILFRDQVISEDEQVRFASYFGEPSMRLLNRHDGTSKHHPGVMFISNIRENGQLIGALPDGEMMFHSDQCYIERPAMASMLYAIEIPSKGGNTLFGNMYAAWDALSPAMQSRLLGLRAMNVYDYGANPTQRGEVTADALQQAHPVVRTHPRTGRRALYINRLMTHYIVDMPRAESDALLAELFDHLENPAWVYEHVWRPGDLLMWDNRCTVHARSDFDASERRLMRRCTVLGDVPV
jgi:taurine dioxygenase